MEQVSTPIRTKISESKTPTTDSSKGKEKCKNITYQRICIQTQFCQTHCQENLIRPTTENIKSKDAIKLKTLEIQYTGLVRLIVKRL